MSFTKILKQGSRIQITLSATQSIAVKTAGSAKVYRVETFDNIPNVRRLEGTVTATETVFGTFTGGATIEIDADEQGALFAVGVGPVITDDGKFQVQGDPGVLNATGALTAAMMLSGIVTSTTASAVAGTVPTGTVLDAANAFAIGDSFDWSVINTGGTNSFTVTAATGHTVVGIAIVLTEVSTLFRTRKTAANTFITYRIGG